MLWLDPFNRGESYLNADFLPQSNPGGGVHGTPTQQRVIMTKKDIVEKLNKEYPKLLKNINNKKISQKDKKKIAMEFTDFLQELADNTPNEKQFNTKKKR